MITCWPSLDNRANFAAETMTLASFPSMQNFPCVKWRVLEGLVHGFPHLHQQPYYFYLISGAMLQPYGKARALSLPQFTQTSDQVKTNFQHGACIYSILPITVKNTGTRKFKVVSFFHYYLNAICILMFVANDKRLLWKTKVKCQPDLTLENVGILLVTVPRNASPQSSLSITYCLASSLKHYFPLYVLSFAVGEPEARHWYPLQIILNAFLQYHQCCFLCTQPDWFSSSVAAWGARKA